MPTRRIEQCHCSECGSIQTANGGIRFVWTALLPTYVPLLSNSITKQQHRSGLGIEAQQAAVTRFAEAEGFTIIREYVEAETGKGADALDRRPQLAVALAA